MQRKNSVSQ